MTGGITSRSFASANPISIASAHVRLFLVSATAMSTSLAIWPCLVASDVKRCTLVASFVRYVVFFMKLGVRSSSTRDWTWCDFLSLKGFPAPAPPAAVVAPAAVAPPDDAGTRRAP